MRYLIMLRVLQGTARAPVVLLRRARVTWKNGGYGKGWWMPLFLWPQFNTNRLLCAHWLPGGVKAQIALKIKKRLPNVNASMYSGYWGESCAGLSCTHWAMKQHIHVPFQGIGCKVKSKSRWTLTRLTFSMETAPLAPPDPKTGWVGSNPYWNYTSTRFIQ